MVRVWLCFFCLFVCNRYAIMESFRARLLFKFLILSLSNILTGHITETIISNFLSSCSRFITCCSLWHWLCACVSRDPLCLPVWRFSIHKMLFGKLEFQILILSSYNFLAESYNIGCYLQLLFIEPSYVCQVPLSFVLHTEPPFSPVLYHFVSPSPIVMSPASNPQSHF